MHNSLQRDALGALKTPARRQPIGGMLLATWSLAVIAIAIALVARQWLQLAAPVSPAATPAGDITIGAAGCAPAEIDIAAIQDTQLSVVNQAAEPMVLTIPSLDQMITLAPGQRGSLSLPALPSGSYGFACLSASAHSQLIADTARGAFVCGLDLNAVRKRALTSGALLAKPRKL
jgi:hypothetical protein